MQHATCYKQDPCRGPGRIQQRRRQILRKKLLPRFTKPGCDSNSSNKQFLKGHSIIVARNFTVRTPNMSIPASAVAKISRGMSNGYLFFRQGPYKTTHTPNQLRRGSMCTKTIKPHHLLSTTQGIRSCHLLWNLTTIALLFAQKC